MRDSHNLGLNLTLSRMVHRISREHAICYSYIMLECGIIVITQVRGAAEDEC